MSMQFFVSKYDIYYKFVRPNNPLQAKLGFF